MAVRIDDERNSCAERGSILPLLVLIALIVLIFAGLAIDSTMLTTAKVQHRQLAEYVALESLHTYIRTPGTVDVKLDAARQQAQEISSLNLLIGERLAGMSSGPSDIQTNRAADPAGVNGKLSPGIWWYRPPPTVCDPNCPCVCISGGGTYDCTSASSWTGQFFQEVNLDSFPLCQINAFKADLIVDSSSSIPLLFMQVTGLSQGTTFPSSAIAATYPRRGVMLVDLSRASHVETHIPYESTGGAGQDTYSLLSSEYALRFTSNTCADYNSGACAAQYSCPISGGVVQGLYSSLWYVDNTLYGPTAGQPLNYISGAARDATLPPTKHYKADYQCFDVSFNDLRLPVNPNTTSFLVDMYRDPGNSYYGPEPLSTMLHGVNQGYTLMANNPAPGDQLGLIGFDMSATVSERTFPLSAPGSVTYLEAQNITDVTNNPPCVTDNTKTADYCRIKNHMFITRDTSGSNIAEALQVAHGQLIASSSTQPAENFVILFSSGLANCKLDRTCGNLETDYNLGYADIGSIVNSYDKPDKIAVHVVGVGDMTGPHTLVVPSPARTNSGVSTDCMSEQEAKDYDPPVGQTDPLSYTDYDGGYTAQTFKNASLNFGGTFPTPQTKARTTQFFGPNKLYEYARDTGGHWFPLRTPCQAGGVNANISGILKSACAGQTFSQASGRPTPIIVPSYTDAFGRLQCDPRGINRRLQVEEAMKEILGRSPFLIVE